MDDRGMDHRRKGTALWRPGANLPVAHPDPFIRSRCPVGILIPTALTVVGGADTRLPNIGLGRGGAFQVAKASAVDGLPLVSREPQCQTHQGPTLVLSLTLVSAQKKPCFCEGIFLSEKVIST